MILINTKPIDDALADFFENNDTGSALYRLDFDEVIRRFPGTSQDNLDTNTIKVEALQSEQNVGGSYAFLNINLAPLNVNVLNFFTFVKLESLKIHFALPVSSIINIDYDVYNLSDFVIFSSSDSINKPIVQNTTQSELSFGAALYYNEVFTEEALRAYPGLVSYYLVRYLLEVMHYNLLLNVIPANVIAAPIFPQVSLNATNIKDVMHYFESYMYNALEGEDDRLVFMLHPYDYQRLIRLKDSAGNYVFCSNCVWDNKIDLGKSIIVNAGWHSNAIGGSPLISPGRFIVFPKSKVRFIYSGDLYFRIVRDGSRNLYNIELYAPCTLDSGLYYLYPYAGNIFSSYVFVVDYIALLGNV